VPVRGGKLYGLVSPAGTPEAIVAKLNKEIAAVQDLPEVQKRLRKTAQTS